MNVPDVEHLEDTLIQTGAEHSIFPVDIVIVLVILPLNVDRQHVIDSCMPLNSSNRTGARRGPALVGETRLGL
jgi:hypothetical protein